MHVLGLAHASFHAFGHEANVVLPCLRPVMLPFLHRACYLQAASPCGIPLMFQHHPLMFRHGGDLFPGMTSLICNHRW